MTEKAHSVTVFSTQTCHWCVRAKDYLDRNGVSYKDVNVGEDQVAASHMVMKSGQMGVPQLWIDDEVVVGFDIPKINALLGIS